MRFPHYLFGFPMTVGLWYVLIFVGAVLVLWIISKIFQNVIKDFASGLIIFVLILAFGFVAANLLSGADSISSSVDTWFNNLFR